MNFFSLRNHKSIQEQLAQFMTLQLVSKESIFSMINILFSDMSEDYKKLEFGEDSDDGKDDHNF